MRYAMRRRMFPLASGGSVCPAVSFRACSLSCWNRLGTSVRTRDKLHMLRKKSKLKTNSQCSLVHSLDHENYPASHELFRHFAIMLSGIPGNLLFVMWHEEEHLIGQMVLLVFNIQLQVVAQKTSRYERLDGKFHGMSRWEISLLITPPPLEIWIIFKFPAVLKFSR